MNLIPIFITGLTIGGLTATFVIATMPVFFGLGWVTTVLGDAFQQKFLKVAALVLVYLGVISINSGLNVIGSPITLHSGECHKHIYSRMRPSLSY